MSQRSKNDWDLNPNGPSPLRLMTSSKNGNENFIYIIYTYFEIPVDLLETLNF